jgi:hypothetical protein
MIVILRDCPPCRGAAGSAMGLLNVCLALVTFCRDRRPRLSALSYLIDFARTVEDACPYKMLFVQAVCHKPFPDPAPRCHTSRSRFCSAPLPFRKLLRNTTPLCKTSTRSCTHSLAQDDTRGIFLQKKYILIEVQGSTHDFGTKLALVRKISKVHKILTKKKAKGA